MFIRRVFRNALITAVTGLWSESWIWEARGIMIPIPWVLSLWLGDSSGFLQKRIDIILVLGFEKCMESVESINRSCLYCRIEIKSNRGRNQWKRALIKSVKRKKESSPWWFAFTVKNGTARKPVSVRSVWLWQNTLSSVVICVLLWKTRLFVPTAEFIVTSQRCGTKYDRLCVFPGHGWYFITRLWQSDT